MRSDLKHKVVYKNQVQWNAKHSASQARSSLLVSSKLFQTVRVMWPLALSNRKHNPCPQKCSFNQKKEQSQRGGDAAVTPAGTWWTRKAQRQRQQTEQLKKSRVRKVLGGGEESQTQVRLCMAGGSQDKQLQSLQQPSRSRLPGQERSGTHWSRKELWLHTTTAGKSSLCTEAAPLPAGHQALIWSYICH